MSAVNPYEAPRVAAGEAVPTSGIVSESSEAGSQAQIGERRAFDVSWIQRGRRLRILMLVPVVVVATNLLDPIDTFDHFWRHMGLTLLVSFGVILVLPIYQGLPPVGSRDARRLARDRNGFTVDLTYAPRLPDGKRLHRLDTADDIGVLWVEGDRLCFEGDRSILQIARADVRRIGRKRVVGAILSGAGDDALVELEEPIAGQSAFHVSPRHRFNIFWNFGPGRRLRRFVDQWYAGGPAGRGAS